MTERDETARAHGARSRAKAKSEAKERGAIDQWSPANTLETPDDGEYHYRWIAEMVNGHPTPNNVQRRLREKWIRVRREDLPEDFVVNEESADGDGYARRDGQILMRIPKAMKAQRDAFYLQQSQARAEAVDTLQGIAGRDAIREDRGTRVLEGAEAGQFLNTVTKG
jgi:hypothetical protein